MGKPGGSSGGGKLFKGTSGNDTFHVASLDELKTSTYDGLAGTDTLDLRALTTGLSISLVAEQSFKNSPSALWPDYSFTGFFTDHSLTNIPGQLSGTISNVERVIGTSGGDHIALGNSGYGDGGPGNDYVVGGFVVGGLGSDYLDGTGPSYGAPAGSTEVLVGGTYVNGVATGDNATDWFEINGGPAVILDFEVGIDKLVLPNSTGDPSAIANAVWQPTTYNGAPSSVLSVNGQVITLAGITPDVANTIKVGQGFYNRSVATVTSGPGDDIIWPSTGPTQLVFGHASGNDIITHFTIADDQLNFTGGAPSGWSNVSVNGEQAIQGYYDNGSSSVTILGLTTADVSHLLIQSSGAAAVSQQVMSDYAMLF